LQQNLPTTEMLRYSASLGGASRSDGTSLDSMMEAPNSGPEGVTLSVTTSSHRTSIVDFAAVASNRAMRAPAACRLIELFYPQ
jgi:hypothetical protein